MKKSVASNFLTGDSSGTIPAFQNSALRTLLRHILFHSNALLPPRPRLQLLLLSANQRHSWVLRSSAVVITQPSARGSSALLYYCCGRLQNGFPETAAALGLCGSMASSPTSPGWTHPYQCFLADDLFRSILATSEHSEAIAHPATIRGQREHVYNRIVPPSMCVHLKGATAGGGDECAERRRNAGDGNCQTHALLNGLRASRGEVRGQQQQQ